MTKQVIVLRRGDNKLLDSLPCVHKVDLAWFRSAAPTGGQVKLQLAAGSAVELPLLRSGDTASDDYDVTVEVKPFVRTVRSVRVELEPDTGTDFEVGVCLHSRDPAAPCDPSESSLPDPQESGLRQAYVVVTSTGKSGAFSGMQNITSIRLLDAVFPEDYAEPYATVLVDRTPFYVPASHASLPGNTEEYVPPVGSGQDLEVQFSGTAPGSFRLLFDVHWVPRREDVPYGITSHECKRVVVDSRERLAGTSTDFTFEFPETIRNASKVSLVFARVPSNGTPFFRLRIAEVDCCWAVPYERDGSSRAVVCSTVQTKSLNPPRSLRRLTVQLLGGPFIDNVDPILFLDISYDPRRETFEPKCKSAYT